MPEELAEQLSPLYEIINKMDIPLISLDGYEADDLIGTIAKKAEIDDFETFLERQAYSTIILSRKFNKSKNMKKTTFKY